MDILIVDDVDANRKLLKNFLMARGYGILEAKDGGEAIDVFVEHRPSMVLMDIMMPGMNGYDATTNIKAFSGDSYTPVIYVTALKPEDAMAKAIEAGGDDFVCKPVSLEILESKINAHLRIRELNEKLNIANAELQAHNRRLQHEHEVVEHIFNNALKYSWLDERCLRYYISPVSAFNGDIFLSERRPDGGLCIMLGDFTGHGLPAAMGTLPVVKTFFTMVQKGLGVCEIASEINATLKMLLPTNMFCSAILIEMDQHGRELTMWSGGLPPLMLRHPSSGDLHTIRSRHMPLGILPAEKFEANVETLAVEPDSRLYLYTDGIIENRNAQGEMYGFDRIRHVLSLSQTDYFSAILHDLDAFSGGSSQRDDLTLVELVCAPLPDRDAE